ncbi:hypothetical protein [Nonomuraea gerenzanensis]|uniref:Uncharacterized protein n=1 Tax=Nonomuraea gerenzanensis TaxID=93944 RepID=A0A1M4EF82_9ACTN|nr:hypothetical protein [Nonomuraea gerenzanensis]UBU08994.1 hypothetical protein LCN96_31980 [Nonomuraea gerenzanensis]SBO97376.1 hypothetical protein BN4615_P6892 [Nonomuraea gerenzanensis]
MRTTRTPLFLLSGAVVLALAGWWQYEAAVPSFPVVGGPSTVSLLIRGPAQDVDVKLTATDAPGLLVEVLATFDLGKKSSPAIPESGCVQAEVHLLTDRPPPPVVTQICPSPPPPGTTRTRGLMEASFKVADPMVARSGSTTLVSMPEVSATWYGLDHEYDVDYEVAFAHRGQADENGLKPEAVSPEYRGPGLRWTRKQAANNPGFPDPGPYGTFTDVAAEKAANRSLFWAGLLGGAALTVLAWAGDLVLARTAERRRERERRAEAEAERREIAELAAARVLAVLDERLPAATSEDAAATRRRPAGRVASSWRSWLRRLLDQGTRR